MELDTSQGINFIRILNKDAYNNIRTICLTNEKAVENQQRTHSGTSLLARVMVERTDELVSKWIISSPITCWREILLDDTSQL